MFLIRWPVDLLQKIVHWKPASEDYCKRETGEESRRLRKRKQTHFRNAGSYYHWSTGFISQNILAFSWCRSLVANQAYWPCEKFIRSTPMPLWGNTVRSLNQHRKIEKPTGENQAIKRPHIIIHKNVQICKYSVQNFAWKNQSNQWLDLLN